MPEKNEWLLPSKTMMWWIIYVISFISNVILFLFNSHTFIVKLYKSVACWMCIYVYAWYELNEKWIKYGIIILKYGVFILFGQTCDEGTCHVGTLWPGYRGVPSSQVSLHFHPILTCVFHASSVQVFSYCTLPHIFSLIDNLAWGFYFYIYIFVYLSYI